MDKKTLGIGIAIGVVGTGILNVVGSLIGGAIARKNAKKLVESVLDECNNECDCDTCNCAETEE